MISSGSSPSLGPQDAAEEEALRAGRVGLEAGRAPRPVEEAQSLASCSAPRRVRTPSNAVSLRLEARRSGLESRRDAGLVVRSAGRGRGRVVLDQRAVVLREAERVVERRGADPAPASARVELGRELVDVAGRRPAGRSRPRRARERARTGAAARPCRRPCAGSSPAGARVRRRWRARTGAARGRGPGRAAGSERGPAAFSSLALVVEQDRVRARRRREGALDQTDDRDRAKAEVAQRVDVEDVHAAQAECARRACSDLVAAQVLDRGAHGVAEALADTVSPRASKRRGLERVEDRLGVVDVAVEEPPR